MESNRPRAFRLVIVRRWVCRFAGHLGHAWNRWTHECPIPAHRRHGIAGRSEHRAQPIAGLVFDPQKAVLTGTMPPGTLRVEANATIAGQPGMNRQVAMGVRESRALEVAFTFVLRIFR